MSEHINLQQDGAVLTITINRPRQKNALTHAMYEGLREGLETAEADSGIRATVISGTEDCFTAGNDLGDFARGLPGDFQETAVGRFLLTLVECRKPVVAAPCGAAVGIGTTMLLHCDLVYCGNNVRFQLPFVNLGVCPEAASSLLLPQWLGRARASELLLLGDPFDGNTAVRLGLANQVLPAEEALTRAHETAQRLAQRPPAALRASKALIRDSCQAQVKATMLREGTVFAERLKSPEAREAFMAFAEKREADFSKFE
ncbi:enoyl-CoA hydratase [Marinobacteraceae bacterium S3BR75-40.1]